MREEEVSWVGLKVGNYLIDSLVNDGPFSWVYRGTDLNGGPDAAFKVAKPKESLEINGGDVIQRTQATTIFEGGVADVLPDARDILLSHYDKMQECHHPALIAINSIVDEPDMCFLQMEFLDGLTLRDVITAEVSIATFIEIACHLDELSKTTFEYHGDLRPDNILITESGIKLADSGYFGILNCEEGPDLDCVVTNGFYYPCLEPNDRMAFGIMLWEAAVKSHPLQYQQPSQIIGDSLEEWISAYEEMGQYFLSPLRNIKRPSDINPDLDPAVEAIIFQAMGLKLADTGLIERDRDDVGFQEFVASLNKIKDLKL